MKNCGKAGLSICWACDKACGKCSWLRDFTPVKGWKAEKKIRRKNVYGNALDSVSYTVKKCPEFAPELKRDYTICDEGMELLARKVLIETGRDYKNARADLREMRSLPMELQHKDAIREKEHTIKSIERFLTEDNIYADALHLEGESLLNGLRRNR